VKKLEYTVRFTTPAFLGNAEQAGQWRTPPFKAMIRVAAAQGPAPEPQQCREGCALAATDQFERGFAKWLTYL
jgi:hypothetical protein